MKDGTNFVGKFGRLKQKHFSTSGLVNFGCTLRGGRNENQYLKVKLGPSGALPMHASMPKNLKHLVTLYTQGKLMIVNTFMQTHDIESFLLRPFI